MTALILTLLLLGQRDTDVSAAIQRMTDMANDPMSARAARWRCRSLRATTCTAHGCQDAAPTIIVRLDLASSIYSRCDAKGCDDRDARQSTGGMFTIVNATEASVFKALNDGSEFVDVATLGTGVFLNFGGCEPLP